MKIKLTTTNSGLRLNAPPYSTEGLTVSILGNKGAGKSNTLAVFAEEFHHNHIPFLFFDPNGDAISLAELGDDIITVGNPNHDDPTRRADYPIEVALQEAKDFIRMNLKEGYSFVFDLTDNDPNSEIFRPLSTFTGIINQHFRQAGKLRTPCGIIVDEAHTFAPQSGADEFEQCSRRALRRISTDGRKRGQLLITATQRVTYLDKAIVFGANVRVFGKITWWPDYDLVKHYVPYTFHQLKEFKSGEAAIVTNGNYGKVQIKLRQTTDLGKTPAFKVQKRKTRPSKIQQLQLPTEKSK